MNSFTTFAPGREGIDIGTQADLRKDAVCPGRFPDIGVLSPRRVAAAVSSRRSCTRGNSSHVWKLAGLVCRFPRGGRPALFLWGELRWLARTWFCVGARQRLFPAAANVAAEGHLPISLLALPFWQGCAWLARRKAGAFTC